MLQFHIGDNMVSAFRSDSGMWTVTSVDLHSGLHDVREVSDREFACIMALIIAADDLPHAGLIREVADNATADWKSKPIP